METLRELRTPKNGALTAEQVLELAEEATGDPEMAQKIATSYAWGLAAQRKRAAM